MLTPHLQEQELTRDQTPDFRHHLARARVGWNGDPDPVDHGNQSEDGVTLVKITMISNGPLDGHEYLAAVAAPGGVWKTPPKDALVLVAIPDGAIETPGNAVIVAEIGRSPKSRFGRNKVVIDVGPDADLVLAGRSVSMISQWKEDPNDPSSPARSAIVSVSKAGGVQATIDGTGLFCHDGQINLKVVGDDGTLKTAAVLSSGDATLLDATVPGKASFLTLKSGNVTMVAGGFVTIGYGTSLKLGLGASPATPALGGLSGLAAVPSTSIFVQVTP